MRPSPIRRRVLLLGAFLLSLTSIPLAGQGPVAAMYADDQTRGQAIALGFATAELPQTASAAFPAQIYLSGGDLQRAFDDPRFRAQAAIVPTNTELRLTAPSPGTQQVLVERLLRQPDVMRSLEAQIEARRGASPAAAGRPAGVLEIGIDSFVARLAADGGQTAGSLPGVVCLVATDFADGGAVNRRELFAQDRVRKGIAGCLAALDAAGAQSLILPLVGAASSGRQANDPLYEGQRVLKECRLVNAIAGIALGIHDFAPNRRNLREIGIIQWDQEVLDMFGVRPGTSMSRAAQTAYRTYANQVKLAMRNGLAGQKTTSSDVSGSCNSIFNARPQ